MSTAGAAPLKSATPGHALADLFFLLSFCFCTYNFYKAMRTDPGFVPTPDPDVKLVRPKLAKADPRLLRSWLMLED